MKIISLKSSVLYAALAALTLTGCAQKAEIASTECSTIEECSKLLDSQKSAIGKSQDALSAKEKEIQALQAQLESAKSAATSTVPVEGVNDLYPPNAKPGECYARVLIPAEYKTETVKLLKKQEGAKLEVIPAQYGYDEQKVLVKEASAKLVTVPATYGYTEEKVLVKEASQKIVKVPAVYETVSEKILVKPGYTTWKSGRGPVEKLDAATGEIMCLVEVPPVYKTVTKKVVKTPATTKTVEIPAEYKTVKKRVVKTPATTKTVEIPAVYETIKVKKVIAPATTRTIAIPAEYQTVTKRVKVSDAVLKWRPILCETNFNIDIVRELQRALAKENLYKGPIDGIYGPLTTQAVRQYQKAKGLPSGALTLSTLKSLGITY